MNVVSLFFKLDAIHNSKLHLKLRKLINLHFDNSIMVKVKLLVFSFIKTLPQFYTSFQYLMNHISLSNVLPNSAKNVNNSQQNRQ